jgi:peptidyl-tRNA hydrolase
MKVKEAFEIQAGFQTGHAPGLVVVLDILADKDSRRLVGQKAVVRTPHGTELRLNIDEAKEHGLVNSLFFRNLGRDDIPPGSDIRLESEITAEPPGISLSPTS